MARNKFDVDESLVDESFNIHAAKRLKKYVAAYKKTILTTILVMTISSAIGLMGPFMLKLALDEYIPMGIDGIWGIAAISGIMLISLFVNAMCMKYKIGAMAKVGQGIIHAIRADMFKHLQTLHFSYFDSRPHGKILVRVVNYVNSLSDLLSNGIINIVTDIFGLILILIMMFWLDVRLALVSMAGLPLLIGVTLFIRIKQRVAWRETSAKQSNLNAYINESVDGMRVTQAFVREGVNQNIFDTICKSVKSSWLKAVRVMMLMPPSAEFIAVLTAALLFAVGVHWLDDGSGTGITIGVLIAFNAYAVRFWQPINSIADIYNSVVSNMAYLERILELIDEPVVVHDIDGAENMPLIAGNISFENVVFSYDAGRIILDGVNFSVNPGDTIALVGPTGAGKTTIVNLLSRFYDLDSGRILIDGTDISAVNLNSLRSQMGIMLQDTFIFSGTVIDNIRYGKLDATDDEIIAVSKLVCAHDFIMSLEKGYQTEVNERGSRLSVGQRQLISFARALLANPRILILDEATSSIDTKTELNLQEGLKQLLKNRTSFVIAHRLSTIKSATKIMYIDDKNIVEAGTHEELLALKGPYYNLYTAQSVFLEKEVV